MLWSRWKSDERETIMSARMLVNRRLREEEIGKWIDLVNRCTHNGCVSKDTASGFLRLPETVAFLSTIDDDLVGGTAIFRDQARLGIVLCSVAIRKANRESSSYHVIKTSLPFLKTVAIHDVDAIIAKDTREAGIGFPASLELDSWMLSILERIGFKQVGTVWSNTLDYKMEFEANSRESNWDHKPNIDGAKDLISSQSKAAGLDTSITWATLVFAYSRGALKTYSKEGAVRIVASIDRMNENAIVSILAIDPKCSEDAAVDMIAADLCKKPTAKVYLPLIGEGQLSLVDLLVEKMGASLQKRPLMLLKKNL
jgi:hypothetical protein